MYKTYTVTFIADGKTVAQKTVRSGEALTDIPEIPTKDGYTETTPYWDVNDFSSIKSDLTVNAVYTADSTASASTAAPTNPQETSSTTVPDTSSTAPTASANSQNVSSTSAPNNSSTASTASATSATNAPKTGADNLLFVWVALVVALGAALTIVWARKYREKQ